MKKKDNLFHHSACISLLLLTLIVFRPDIAACAAPTLEWVGYYGLWNDGVTPDYGTTSTTFTFKVIYTDSDNDAPYTGYPKVHILQGGTEIGSYTMTQDSCGGGDCDGNYTNGERYYYTTTLATTGIYTYYFEAKDSNEDIAGFSSPTNEHTLTVVSGYVWVDGDFTGTSDGSYANPYKTIADGISNAVSGQAVRVLPFDGTPYEYQETLTMVSGVHLVSDNSSSGDSEATYNDPYSSYSTSMLTRTGRTTIQGGIAFPITLTADVVVDGFTVYRYGGGNQVMDIEGKSPIVKNNIVYWSSTIGTACLEMDAGSSGTHEPIIENNLFHRVNTRGISVGPRISPIIQDNEIWDTAQYPGIGINSKGVSGSEITILHNHIFDCGGPGIGSTAIAKDTKVTIQGNNIHDNGFDSTVSGKPLGAGISLARGGSPGTDLEPLEIIIGGSEPAQGNQIYNSTLAGIILDSNNDGMFPVLIQNNDIYDNGKAGIVLIDAGFRYDPPGPTPPGDPIIAEVLDNTIYGHTSMTGILIGGATYADIAYNAIYDNYSGIAFNMASLAVDPDDPSSGTVNIEDNDIYSNTMAGITVRDAITGDVTIAGNDLYQNDRGGICITNSCENLVINSNDINNNIRGGIHTGTYVADDYFAGTDSQCTGVGTPYPCCTGLGTGTCESSGGFIGTADSALLEVSQNKVYNNGLNSYGGGVDIRHASGSIFNNLIYENRKGGIRFGDYIDEIINNTVVDNGHVVDETEKYGGGICYDDLDGAVNDTAGGYPLFNIPIRNNITAFNVLAGIRIRMPDNSCDTTGTYRDYNLIYGNNDQTTGQRRQLYRCLGNTNEIFALPQFVDRDNDDYRLDPGPPASPAVDAGDTSYGTDVSLPPGVGTPVIDMGAYGGLDGLDW
jgi:hypothetical protein